MSASEDTATTFATEMGYLEPRASTKEWIKDTLPTRTDVVEYAKTTFPVLTWFYRYNWQWLIGDLIAGLTVSVVVIPQSMAYAKLAQLPPYFGLYSSFLGVIIYCATGTSKDITIGPVAVMSTLMGEVLNDVLPELPQYQDTPWVVASALSVVLGCIVAGIGFARLGFIVDFIPLPAIAAFMTGSALSIAMGQVPSLMGNNKAPEYNTREATYLVFGNFFKNIKYCDVNAALGLTALALLYFIRWGSGYCSRRWPKYQRTFFFSDTLRTAFVILLYTFVSFLVNHSRHGSPRFSILGDIPRGFKHVGVPHIRSDILSATAGRIPSAVIVLVIEHVSIAKSFGRVNNYTINPNQELIAIGISNIFGPFFGAYPVTGSFSRTAVNSKAGVRTPFAGVITGLIVVVSIYALPAVLYYVPNAVLAAVIIHAVGNLVTGPKTLRGFWQVSPFEFLIFWAGVFVSVFSSIDNGIYTTVSASAVLMLFRIAKARGKFVGQIEVYDTVTDSRRNVYVPFDHSDGSNPAVDVKSPPSGIFIYRLNEGYLYPNAVHFTDHMVEQIMHQTRPGVLNPYGTLGNRPWNDPGPRHKTESDIDTSKPELRSLILDFTGVSHVDITSVQNLLDVRQQLDRHAACSVSWHFVGLKSSWTRRALMAAGFGAPVDSSQRPVFTVAHVGLQRENCEKKVFATEDSAAVGEYDQAAIIPEEKTVPIRSVDRPFFHIDMDEALVAAKNEINILSL